MIGHIVTGLHDAGIVAVGDFESIATTTIGAGGATDVTFTSIPGTYQHLQIRMMARVGSITDLLIQVNGDTATNSNVHFLAGNGSAASSGGFANQSYIGWKTLTATADTFSVGVLDILDYANTNKNKTTRALSGDDTNGGGAVVMHSGAWRSTNAITSIKLYVTSSSIAQHSHFALYGIKG